MADRNVTRRDFVRTLGLGATAAAIAPSLGAACARIPGSHGVSPSASTTGWDLVPSILARIRPPTFPARDFVITSYGAVGDGTTLCTDAIRQAIATCSAAGGGRVVVPAGRFLTGAVHLKSNVNLHVAAGATLLFSKDPSHYLPVVLTRWEGTELMSYSAFIYAYDQENIAITGEGTLDGQADATAWWPWNGSPRYGGKPGQPNQGAARQKLMQMGEAGVPVEQRVFGEGSYLRPNFVQPYRCRNILIEGVTIVRSPMWELNPVLSQNVTVRGVKISSHGPNNDGCDPEACRDVLIEDCEFDTGDDCIAIKSGRNADGRRVGVPVENVIVRKCRMKDGHGGVTIGSEISGGARNIFAEQNQMDSPNLERGLRLKTNAMRGGVLEHVYMRDCTVGQVSTAVLSIDFNYEEGPKGNFPPTVRDIEMRNVTSGKSQYALYLRGFENDPIHDVRVIDCTFSNVARESVVENVDGLSLKNVTINGKRVAAADGRGGNDRG
jgi:polygalacturonase